MSGLTLFLLVSSLVFSLTFAVTTLSNPSVAFTPSVNLTSSKEAPNFKSDIPLPNSNKEAPTAIANANVKLTVPMGASEQGRIPFEPQNLRLNAGDKIIVMNMDLVPHSVTSGTGPQDMTSGKFFDSLLIEAGKSSDIFTSKLSPGQYDFFCIIHPFMKGKIQILDKNPGLKSPTSRISNASETSEKASRQSGSTVTPLPETNQPVAQENGSRPVNDNSNPNAETNASNVKIVKGSSDPAIGQFYSPSPVTISAGSTITWTNDDDTLHTVTSGLPGEPSGKDFDSGYLAAGSLFQHTFNTAGSFDYWCTLHPHMTGKVMVR